MAEPFATPTTAHRLPADLAGVGEVQVLHCDGGDVVPARVVDQAGDGVADLGIPVGTRAGQLEFDSCRLADRVAVLVEALHREVAVVEVNRHHRAVSQDLVVSCLGGDAEGFGRYCPGGGQVDAGPAGAAGDGIGDGLSAGDPGLPLGLAVGECRSAG